MEKFSEIIKDLIDEQNLSLRKIGLECGFTSGQLSRWVNGKIPTIDNAVKLCKYFDCSLDYLFGLSEEKQHTVYIHTDYDFNLFITRYLLLLKENNFSHSQFTRKSDINESCLRDWKKGHKPLMRTIVIIATNLSCSIDYLLGRT